MTKSVLVPVADGTEEIEAVTVIDLLRRAGAHVTVAGVGSTSVICANGTKLLADCSLEACSSNSFDLIALPGGDEGALNFQRSATLLELLKKQDQAGKWLAAICASPALVLEHRGLIRGRRATCYPSYAHLLRNQESVNERVVVDGNLITSMSPGSAMEFGLKLVSVLVDEEAAERIAAGIFFKT